MENKDIKANDFDEVGVVNDFDWFGYEWDIFENLDSPESFDGMDTIQTLNKEDIDNFVSQEDYFWLEEYLEKLDENERLEANEYIAEFFPEFLKDEERSTTVQIKANSFKNEEIAKNVWGKQHFNNRADVQDELWDVLDSYKYAA